MLDVLRNPTFARLFSAQVVALFGTGLLTIALALLAFDLAGAQAGAVLGTALGIKMIAYVGLAPVSNALTERLPCRAVLIGADLVRGTTALALPFVETAWQIYLLVFVLQAASAAFTPAFQATIPDVLRDETDYTRALSLSRLAYDLENLLSPALAAVLLTVVSYHWLFAGTVVGFAGSAALVALTALPARQTGAKPRSFSDRLTRGMRIYLATPRLRGLLALNMAAAAAGAFVIVNTVVLTKVGYGAGEIDVAVALAAFGAGSMLAAVALPRILESVSDRAVMVQAGGLLAAGSLIFGLWLALVGLPGWAALLAAWLIGGILYSSVLTPSGRLLRRSAHSDDRPAVFAAQFALSHACWLLTYAIAGWGSSVLGLGWAMVLLGVVALASVALGRRLWPRDDPRTLTHEHPDLPADHPHLRAYPPEDRRHRHVLVIDDEHRIWPSHG